MRNICSKTFLLGLFSVLFLLGCTTIDKNSPKKHMLWKISDSNSSVYLMGSVHFADRSFYPLDTVITNAFDASEELAVELDMSDTAVVKDIAVQTELLGKLEEGKTLAQILPEGVLSSFDSLCLSWYIPSDALYGYKPWAAAMTIGSIAVMRRGFDPRFGIDFFFLHRAHETQKKILALETVEEQVNALAGEGVPDSIGIYSLKSTIRDMRLMDSSITLMMESWKRGDDSLFRTAMYLGEEDGCAEDSLLQAEIEERVYISRNRKMAESITSFLSADRKVFIVVGAAHMTGRGDNVLKLLRDKGLTVEQY